MFNFKENRDTRPVVGWRLMSVYGYRNYRDPTLYTFLASLTRPNLVWSTTGRCNLLEFGSKSPLEMRDIQAMCRPERYSTDASSWVRDGRVKRNSHPVPAENCKCGYAAYHTLEDLINDLTSVAPRHLTLSNIPILGRRDAKPGIFTGSFFMPRTILALAWGFGETIAFDSNFRSEFMTLAALCDEGEHLGREARLHAKEMNIPALSLAEMVEYAPVAGRRLAP